MLDLLPYLPKARYLPDLAPEIAYTVRPSFFYGSGKARPNDLRELSADLTNPRYVRKQQALSLDVEKQEPQLLRYYADVWRVMRQHRKELPACREYFALRPVLLSKGQVVITFPWYDTYPEAAALLRTLQAPEGADGLLFDDMDQGWDVALYAQGERLYLAEGDGERDKPCVVCCTDRARLAALAAATLARLQQQLAYFGRETGQNPWQYRA